MPDRRQHRGPHPEDDARFAPEQHARLLAATRDLSWLSTRGYALPSALQIVGNRHALDARQRKAVERCACSDDARDDRGARRVDAAALREANLWIDGFNVLTTIEAALGGGFLLLARDGCVRDMASMHGNYRRVAETRPAILATGHWLVARGTGPTRWLLDRPVSNSGRLRGVLLELADEHAWPWSVELVDDPDHVLVAEDRSNDHVVATADSWILDRCGSWFPLAREVVDDVAVTAPRVDLAR